MIFPPIVPEFAVRDLHRSCATYCEVLGFQVHASRPEERFVYLVRGAAHLMLEEWTPGHRFDPAPLSPPCGRGMNLQIEVPDVEALYAAVARSGLEVRIALEERWYRQNDTEAGNRQFVVADPDGYLLRFTTPLGRRPAQFHGSAPDAAPSMT